MRVFNNFVSGVLLKDVLDSETATTIECDFGTYTPKTMSTNEFFTAVLYNKLGQKEIVKVKSYNPATYIAVVERAQENTPESVFVAGDFLEERVTAGDLQSFFQTGDGSKSLDSTSVLVNKLKINNTSVQTSVAAIVEGDRERELAFHKDGRPTYDGKVIQPEATVFSQSLPVGTIVYYSPPISGAVIPPNWAVCNGQTVGGVTTPNLADRFIRCYDFAGDATLGPNTEVGKSVDAISATGGGGAHEHSSLGKTAGATISGGNNTLNSTYIPEHKHLDVPAMRTLDPVLATAINLVHYARPVGSNIIPYASRSGSPSKSTKIPDTTAAHTHTFPDDTSHTHTISGIVGADHTHPISGTFEPKSYSLIVLMRVF